MAGELENGIAAIRAGNKSEAQRFLKEAIRVEPKNVAAWLWMSAALDDPVKQRMCLERVLEIDPQNQAALRGLDKLSLAQPGIVAHRIPTGPLPASTKVPTGSLNAGKKVPTAPLAGGKIPTGPLPASTKVPTGPLTTQKIDTGRLSAAEAVPTGPKTRPFIDEKQASNLFAEETAQTESDTYFSSAQAADLPFDFPEINYLDGKKIEHHSSEPRLADLAPKQDISREDLVKPKKQPATPSSIAASAIMVLVLLLAVGIWLYLQARMRSVEDARTILLILLVFLLYVISGYLGAFLVLRKGADLKMPGILAIILPPILGIFLLIRGVSTPLQKD